MMNKSVAIGVIFLGVALGLSSRTLGREPAESGLDSEGVAQGTIAFASLAPRSWDLYLHESGGETRLTQDESLDFNASISPDGNRVAFVSERDGNMEIYIVNRDGSDLRRVTHNFALDDHATWSPDGSKIAFVSTREPAEAGSAWNAVYLSDTKGGAPQRISPIGVSDYSPCWAPDGNLIAVASGSGRAGQSDIVVMSSDGGSRKRVAENGGWPCFIDGGSRIAFHRRGDDERWDVWAVDVDGGSAEVLIEDASMPRANPDGTHIAHVARGGDHQQIAVFDTTSNATRKITSAETDHWNPSISPDGKTVVYHRVTADQDVVNVEPWGTPTGPPLNLVRIAGAFPAFAPDRKRMAFAAQSFAKIDVMQIDGRNRNTIFTGEHRSLFGVAWSHAGGHVAFSHGVVFGDAGATVNIKASLPDGSDLTELTAGSGNNGFPSFSPDGSSIVFRSGRDGQKNLYIMDADGENVRRLTHGDWTDTMCDWSPSGQWITFASDRGGDYEVWLVRPDGTGLHKLIGGGGRHNHPHFSPDENWIVFTSQRAGLSAEEVSLPRQPQPYGDLFMIRTDGSDLTRLTHNGFEEGTPAWSPVTVVEPSREGEVGGSSY